MRVLLDTHALLWFLLDDPALSRAARELIRTPDTAVLVSPASYWEIAIKTMLKGYRVGEVGIQTFPRAFGSGSSTSLPNILATMRDMWRIYHQVFSDSYDLPAGRERLSSGAASREGSRR